MFSEGCVSHSGHRSGGGGGGVRGGGYVVGACVTVGACVAGGVCGWREVCVVGAKHGWGCIPGVCCPGGGAMLSGEGVLSQWCCPGGGVCCLRGAVRGGVVQGVCCLECEQNDRQV